MSFRGVERRRKFEPKLAFTGVAEIFLELIPDRDRVRNDEALEGNSMHFDVMTWRIL